MNTLLPAPERLSQLRLRRLSRQMQIACWVLMAGLPLALVAYWVGASDVTLTAHANLPAQAIQGALKPWQRLSAAAVNAIPLGLLLVGIGQAQRCFGLFAQGEVFTSRSTILLKRFAGWVAWAAGASLVATSVVSMLLTLNNPPGQRLLSLIISSDHVLTFFFAGTVWLMAAVIAQGQRLAEDNAGFV